MVASTQLYCHFSILSQEATLKHMHNLIPVWETEAGGLDLLVRSQPSLQMWISG